MHLPIDMDKTTSSSTYSKSDAELVAQMREGDTSAFEIIVERYRTILTARAYALLDSLADAEDIAQEAFVQAFLHLHELRDPNALLAWLRRVTERLALMHRRRQRENPVAPSDLECIVESRSATDESNDPIDVKSILAELPSDMREVVTLTMFAGYTCAEAACILGVKEGTIKSRLYRARAKLREVLGVTDRNISGGNTSDFTRRTIERLKREARRLAAEGNFEQASQKADDVLTEQVRPLYGDPEKLGIAKTILAAYDNPAFKPDGEAVEMLGLPHKERRRRECEANAAQYGFKLEDLDWQVADVDVMSGTLGKPTGYGKDIWGVPVSRMKLEVIDARELCQRLRVSPLTLYKWVGDGCPVLLCWAFARFDVERVQNWLAEKDIKDWPVEDEYLLEHPIRLIFKAVYEGAISAEQAKEVMSSLGYGVWESPHSGLKGGW